MFPIHMFPHGTQSNRYMAYEKIHMKNTLIHLFAKSRTGVRLSFVEVSYLWIYQIRVSNSPIFMSERTINIAALYYISKHIGDMFSLL